MIWSEFEVARLRSMLEHGAPWKVIATTLKRSLPAVVNKARKLGVRLPPEVAAQRRSETMTRVNRSPEQIAKASAARRSKLAWCKPEWRPVYDKMVRNNGYSASEAREIIERSYVR